MKLQVLAISALAPCALLAGCSSAPTASAPAASTASALPAAAMSADCASVIGAIRPYATSYPPSFNKEIWASDLTNAAQGQQVDMENEQQSSFASPSAFDQRLLGDVTSLATDAAILNNDFSPYAGTGLSPGNPQNIPSDLASVGSFIKNIYADCDQQMP